MEELEKSNSNIDSNTMNSTQNITGNELNENLDNITNE